MWMIYKNCIQQHWQPELCSKFLLISWETIQSLRRSLRSLTFSKVLLTAQQLQRTSLRISYGKLSRQTKEWNFSEKHVLGRCIFPHLPGEVARFYQSCSSASSSSFSSSASSSSPPVSPRPCLHQLPPPLPTLRQSLRQLPRAVGTAGPQLPASALPTLCQGSLKATFAYDSLTDCLRRAYGNFRSPIRILWILVWCCYNTAKKVAFALVCFPYMQWHNGIINHRHSTWIKAIWGWFPLLTMISQIPLVGYFRLPCKGPIGGSHGMPHLHGKYVMLVMLMRNQRVFSWDNSMRL